MDESLAGPLPASWSALDLQLLSLFSNQLSSQLPASVGANGSWPNLQLLNLAGNNFSGHYLTPYAPEMA